MGNREKDRIRLFISHSSRDQRFAQAIIRLTRSALNLPAEHIRCTSVPGYKLDPGVKIEPELRREVHEAEAFVGIITPNSIKSAFVLFELGARWGRNQHLVPIMAGGISASDLRGPLAAIHALKSESREDVIQLAENLAKKLGLSLGSQTSFDDEVADLILISKEIRAAALSPSEKLQEALTEVRSLETELETLRAYTDRSPRDEE